MYRTAHTRIIKKQWFISGIILFGLLFFTCEREFETDAWLIQPNDSLGVYQDTTIIVPSIISPINGGEVSNPMLVVVHLEPSIDPKVLELHINETVFYTWEKIDSLYIFTIDMIPFIGISHLKLSAHVTAENQLVTNSDSIIVYFNEESFQPEPPNLRVEGQGGTEYSLVWSRTSSQDYHSYDLYRASVDNPTYQTLIYSSANPNDTTFVVENIAPYDWSFYSVRINTQNGYNSLSNTLSVFGSGEILVESNDSLFILDLNGTNKIFIDNDLASSWIEFDVENRSLVYTKEVGNLSPAIVRYFFDTNTLDMLYPGDDPIIHFELSPDYNFLYFSSNDPVSNSLVKKNLITGETNILLQSEADYGNGPGAFDLSRDGELIAVSLGPSTIQQNVYLYTISVGVLSQLTTHANRNVNSVTFGCEDERITYLAESYPMAGVYSVDLIGSEPLYLYGFNTYMGIRVSPNGQFLGIFNEDDQAFIKDICTGESIGQFSQINSKWDSNSERIWMSVNTYMGGCEICYWDIPTIQNNDLFLFSENVYSYTTLSSHNMLLVYLNQSQKLELVNILSRESMSLPWGSYIPLNFIPIEYYD